MLAVALSLAAAAAFAASALYIDAVTGRVGPLQVSRWQMGLAFLMTGAIALATGGWRSIDLEMALWLTGSAPRGVAANPPAAVRAAVILGAPRVVTIRPGRDRRRSGTRAATRARPSASESPQVRGPGA